MDPNQQIAGLPPGAVVTPLPAASQVQGLPPGATLAPVGTTATQPSLPALTANPKGEGVYQMAGPGGTAGIPYSKVRDAHAQGMTFANDAELSRYRKDDLADPNSKGTTTYEGGTLTDLNKGFGRAFDQSMLTPEKLIRKIPVVGEFAGQHMGLDKQIAHDQAAADAPNENAAQSVGGAIETVAEFLTGEEALKGLSLGSKLQKIAPVLKQLERFPKTAAILATAIRQGTVGTAQGLLKGDDIGDALESGAVTGGIGGAAEAIIPAAYTGLKNLITKIRPSMTTIEGATAPILASQIPGAAPEAAQAATIAQAPKIAAAQQEAGQTAIQNVAQRATANTLDRVNSVRATAPPITNPARMLPAPEQPFQFTIEGPPPVETQEGNLLQDARKKQIGTKVIEGPGPSGLPNDPFAREYARPTEAGGTEYPEAGRRPAEYPDKARAHREPVWQYLTSPRPAANAVPAEDVVRGGGVMMTTDPQAAQSALSHIEDITNSDYFQELPKEQQAQITSQRDSLQQQLGMYHGVNTLTPHFEPVDVNGAVAHVSNFGEAADQVEAAVKPIYQKLDEVSGGQFTALRNQSKAASKVMFQPGSIDAYQKALESKAEADQGIQDLFNRHSGDVNRTELQSANAAWRDAQVLNNLHSTVEGAFKGAPKNIADSIGTNRLIRGNNLTSRLNRLLQSTPQSDIERVIGSDGLQNLYRVGDLLSKPETAVQTQNAAKEIARELTRRVAKGALVGGLLGHLVGHAAEGALAGAAAEDATRYVLRQAAINPRVGLLIDRAVRHQVSPRIFAPLIAATINHDPQTEATPETQQ